MDVILAAAKRGDLESVRRLLAVDGAPATRADAHGKTALHLAAEHDHPAVVAALLDAGADLEARTDWGMTALQWAGVLGSVAAGAVLIERGAKLDLATAAGLGRLDLVPAQLAAQPDEVSAAFQLACRNGHVQVARHLLELGADIDFPGYFGAPALHWAAMNGHAEMVRFLLEHRADPTIRDHQFGADALGWAREGGHAPVMALLEALDGG
jgi:ankyrin repeat protein